MADAPTSALASAETPEPNLQQVDSIVAAAVAAAEAELQAIEEGAAPAVPGAERESKLSTFEEEDMAASLMSNPTSEPTRFPDSFQSPSVLPSRFPDSFMRGCPPHSRFITIN